MTYSSETPPAQRSNTNDSDVQVVSDSEALNLLTLEVQHKNSLIAEVEKENSSLKARVNRLEISVSTGIHILN